MPDNVRPYEPLTSENAALVLVDHQVGLMSGVQKGDAPQAAALLEGQQADVVMADTAYDADHLRTRIAETGALA